MFSTCRGKGMNGMSRGSGGSFRGSKGDAPVLHPFNRMVLIIGKDLALKFEISARPFHHAEAAQVLRVEIRRPLHAQPCERMAAIASASSSGVASLEIFGIARLVISRVCLGVPSIRLIRASRSLLT